MVRKGKRVWIFNSWDEAQSLVSGFSDAKYKSFPTLLQAEEALKQGRKPYYQVQKKNIWKTRDEMEEMPFVKESIAVDAACSGNPGEMEYRGVDLQTGKEIFRQRFEIWTNNVGEFLAIVHGLAYLQDNPSSVASLLPLPWQGEKNNDFPNSWTPQQVRRCPVRAGVIALYSDSKIAINWVKQGQCRSLLRKKEPDLELRRIVEKAELRLKDYGISFQLLKWKTEDWGEIPADFGRK